MSKQKHKVVRYQIGLNELQKKMLTEMMHEDALTEVGVFFCNILANEYKNRQLIKTKRAPGRPRKDDSDDDEDFDDLYKDDLPKNIPYYGKMIGKKEYEDKIELQKDFKPRG